jgi:subtilase family serine protease
MRPARIAVAAAGALLLGAAGSGAASTTAVTGAAVTGARPAVPAVVIRPGLVRAESARRSPPSTAYCEKHFKIACYQARQIQRAYQLPALYRRGITGAGQTIVIVDSYGSPTVRRDLAVFDKAEGLPAPPSLRVIEPAGKVPPYRPTSNRAGWAGETDLDVEYAHAIAPGARILVVATPTSENEGTTGFPQIVAAEKYVISHHLGAVISQSFSATEQTFPSKSALLSLRSAYVAAARAGVTVLAASGDSGAADVKFDGSTYYLHRVTSWPDSDPLVTGVSGTQLHLAAAGRPRPATVWNDTYNAATNRFILGSTGPAPLAGGGGTSAIFGRPAYQGGLAGVVGDARGVPDISMSAACNGAADMYQSFRGQPAGWYPTCGTSEATPEFAGIVALTAQLAGHPIGLVNPALYRLSAMHAPGLADVIAGGNTVSFRQGGKLRTIRGFRARPGYDLASGVGTVSAPRFVPELALLASHPDWPGAQIATMAAKIVATATRLAQVSRADR